MEYRIRQLLEARRLDDAFEAIAAAFSDKIFRLAYSMLADRASAEEATQETLLRVWKALPKFRGESEISTWIFAIARNRCLTARKSRASWRTFSIEEPSVRRAAEKATRPEPKPDILALLAGLPEHYREVLMLYHMEQKSYEDVAAALNIPLGTVKTYIHRARKQLAEATLAERRVLDGVPGI